MGGRKRKAKLPKYKLLNKHRDGKYINEHGTFTGKTAKKAAAKAWKHHKKEFNLLQGVNHILLLSVETNEPMEPISMDTWSTKKHGKRGWKKGRGSYKKNSRIYKMRRKYRKRSTQRRRTRSKRGGDCGCSSARGPLSAIINQLGGYEYSRRATRDRKKRLRSRIIGASRRRRHTLRRKTRKHHQKRHRGRTRRRRRRRRRHRRRH